MGFIETLFQKRVVKEKTIAKLAKIASVVFYIAGLISFVVGFIRMKNIDVLSPQDMQIHFAILMLGMIVLVLIGGLLELKSDIMKLEDEVTDLK
ncbi:hypothetical protein ACFL6W_09185, partial [Thermodesulfobacteriota bacterium]